MSIIDGVITHYRLFGPKGVYLVAKSRLMRRPIEVRVQTPGLAHPLTLRLRTTDVSVFEEIIVNAEYHFETLSQPRTIVDAGANIGLTSIYLANRFPKARILSIEPEQSNFRMLVKNAAPYPNIVPIHAALWKESVPLNLTNPGGGNWAFQTEERCSDQLAADADAVVGKTLVDIMNSNDCNFIDVLKVDIEGAEKEVFEASRLWIDRVGAIIIELHDRTKLGCRQSVEAATTNFPIKWQKGETIFLVRTDSPLRNPNLDASTAPVATGGRTEASIRTGARSRILAPKP